MMGVKLAPYARTHQKKKHEQALFRRAQARVSSKDFEASIPDFLPHRSF
jgi:hypothetical protein